MVFDDISEDSIACPGFSGTVIGKPCDQTSSILCENDSALDVFQILPAPLANSTMIEEDQGPELSCHDTCSVQPTIQQQPAHFPLPPTGQAERGLKVGPHAFAYIVRDIWPRVNPDLLNSHDLLATYTAVRETCLPNYLSARIPIPSNINCDTWDHLLGDYHDAEIAEYLRFGWPGGYTAPVPPTSSVSNHPSALKFPDHISNFLDKEVTLGAMLGPFTAPPFEGWSQVSPLMTVEKKDSLSRRVIIDLSFPLGLGVNSGVPKNFFQGNHKQYSLPTIHDLAALVVQMGRGCLIWKADLERAYRQLRSDPLDYPLMGVCHQGAYYTDICPSFGCRGSSMAQQRVSEAVRHLMAQEGYPILAYVDDFCGIHSTAARAHAGYDAFVQLTNTLGLKLAEDKSAPPSTEMEWLGFLFNTQEMSITLPPHKLQEIIDLTGTWSAKTRASRRDLQSLAGKLNHISQCVLPARKFMGRILACLRTAPAQGTVFVDDHARRDVAWFVQYASRCNGRLLISEELPTLEIQCDACLEGGGGFSRLHYYSTRFPPDMAERYHISQIEAMNIVLALKSLIPPTTRSTEIIITTDNSAAMHTLNTGKTRDPVLAACSRELWLFAALRELRITVNHAPGATLVLADALSRRHKSREFEDIVIQMTRHLCITQVAPCALDLVLNPEL